MKPLKSFSLFLAAILASSALSACIPNTTHSSPSESGFSSSTGSDAESGFPSSTSSDAESSSNKEEDALLAMWEIVDAAWELEIGQFLDGTHTLTGKVVEIKKVGKRDTITIQIEGRESKPIYCFGITGAGVATIKLGDIATVSGELTNYQGTIEFNTGCALVSSSADGETPPIGNDPYENVSKTEFYLTYSPATSNEDAYYRSLHGFMSGSLTVPDQAPTVANNRPTSGGKYVRNESMLYSEDNNAYTVVDVLGKPAFTVYRSGAYVTLEEVAAYVYAFGTYPANYTASKNTDPDDSIFGEYLRVNHTRFSGDTGKYPYEPELPNISGCGGTLNYYEMDIGTTGTDCDPSYPSELYNDGSSITRGAARIVYGKTDLNGNGIFEIGEFHVFYTYNHYNDFQEYLNYQGGWGEMFGNITGGGAISSKYDYNPTAYVPVLMGILKG